MRHSSPGNRKHMFTIITYCTYVITKNKIYDSELFFKKKVKNGPTYPKSANKNFFTYEFGPTTKKKFIFLCFFFKNFVYSIKDIYIQIELV